VSAAVLGMITLCNLCATGMEDIRIELSCNHQKVPMGHSVVLTATVSDGTGKPLENCLLLPYVNERRWGSHERTDAQGKATFLIPFPTIGQARIEVAAIPYEGASSAKFIWAQKPVETKSKAYFNRAFTVPATIHEASLYVVVDDICTVFLNGKLLGTAQGWHKTSVFSNIKELLTPGTNVIALEAENSEGPAGLMAALRLQTDEKTLWEISDESWETWATKPDNWPNPSIGSGAAAQIISNCDSSLWAPSMNDWPGLPKREDLFAGTLKKNKSVLSKPLVVEVENREMPILPHDETLVGIQWEPWFTPKNAFWQTAHAVPIMGFYDSYNRDVLRQHILWFIDLGINFIMPDWSNHIWGKQHWNERPRETNEIIHATTILLETLAQMRDEGMDVPKVVLMPGLSNGPATTMTAINELLQWIDENYLMNPRFDGLWLDYDGKPLIVILDTATVAQTEPPVNDAHFTVRWMSTQLQSTHHHERGYWSWMDGSIRPVTTFRDGKPEVITVTPAFFAEGGWLRPTAKGRRGGTTYIETFKAALEDRPRVVLLHQWNEFAGQAEGQGYGPNRDIYVDSYSVELSDDLEPVSLTAPGYRGDKGGWGFYYLNLTHALLDKLRGNAPEDTLLAIGSPVEKQIVTDRTVKLEWTLLGPKPTGYEIKLDSQTVASVSEGYAYDLDVSKLSEGQHSVEIVAQGVSTRYALSHVEMDVISGKQQPVSAKVSFVLTKN